MINICWFILVDYILVDNINLLYNFLNSVCSFWCSTTDSFLILAAAPLLIPNTPYYNLPDASYVEQAMTGNLLGDGTLVK